MSKEKPACLPVMKRGILVSSDKNLKNPSSLTKVHLGLRPEEHFKTSHPGGSTNQAMKQ